MLDSMGARIRLSLRPQFPAIRATAANLGIRVPRLKFLEALHDLRDLES